MSLFYLKINRSADLGVIICESALADYYTKIGRPIDFEIEKAHEEE